MAGHRAVAHTADVRIEAWAGGRRECLAEAVRALVESFADPSGVPVERTVPVEIRPGDDADVLVAVLEEVIYRLEVHGELVLDAEAGDGEIRLRVGDAGRAVPVGAVPKAVSLHDLRFEPAPGGWRCAATIDV